MNTIEILVYIYAGLFGLTFCILIGLYVWMYNLSKQVKKDGNKNPYHAFLGTETNKINEDGGNDVGNATAPVIATDLYRDFKMRQAQLKESDATSYTSRQTRDDVASVYGNRVGPNGHHQQQGGMYNQQQQRGGGSRMLADDHRGNNILRSNNNQPQSMGDMIRGSKLVNRNYNQYD